MSCPFLQKWTPKRMAQYSIIFSNSTVLSENTKYFACTIFIYSLELSCKASVPKLVHYTIPSLMPVAEPRSTCWWHNIIIGTYFSVMPEKKLENQCKNSQGEQVPPQKKSHAALCSLLRSCCRVARLWYIWRLITMPPKQCFPKSWVATHHWEEKLGLTPLRGIAQY